MINEGFEINEIYMIMNAYARLNPDSEEANLLKSVAKNYDDILKIWSDAVVEMSREEDATDNSEATIKYSGHRDNYNKPITKEDVDVLRSIGRKSINAFTDEEIKKAKSVLINSIRSLA